MKKRWNKLQKRKNAARQMLRHGRARFLKPPSKKQKKPQKMRLPSRNKPQTMRLPPLERFCRYLYQQKTQQSTGTRKCNRVNA